MTGLKAAAGATKGVYPYGPLKVEIAYNPDTGEVHASTVTPSTLSQWREPIIAVCDATRPMTMQDIADAILDAINRHYD